MQLGLLEQPIDPTLPSRRSMVARQPAPDETRASASAATSHNAPATSAFVVTTGVKTGVRKRLSAASPLPPPPAALVPPTPAPPAATPQGGPSDARAQRVQRECDLRAMLGNSGGGIRAERHGPVAAPSEPLRPPRDTTLVEVVDEVLSRPPSAVAASAARAATAVPLVNNLEKLLGDELQAFDADVAVSRLFKVSGYEKASTIERLTTAIEALPRLLLVLKLYLPLRVRVTAMLMRRRDDDNELYLCLDVLRGVFARTLIMPADAWLTSFCNVVNSHYNIVPAAFAVLLYAHAPTKATLQVVYDVFRFTVSDSEIRKVLLAHSKESYIK